MSQWGAPQKAVINYIFVVTNKRNRDLDNLLSSCKAIQDGLVNAGVIMADDCWHLSIGRVEVVIGEKEQTIITIREEIEDAI